jgi:hypothetical protein
MIAAIVPSFPPEKTSSRRARCHDRETQARDHGRSNDHPARVFLALTFALLAQGCSSSEEPPAEVSDSGTTVTDTAPAPPSKTTGNACSADSDCDLHGDGTNACSTSAFGQDTLFPTPICIGRACAPGDGSKIVRCDGDAGICIASDTEGVCLPSCTFDDTTVSGCKGKNGCVPRAVASDASGKPSGIGYCYGGCTEDADCPSGNVCQPETMLCVKTKAVFGKTIGSPCADGDEIPDGATDTCDCLQAIEPTTGELQGYCVQTCIVGASSSCPSGFTCDAGLAKTGETVLTTQAPGLVGTCQKDCATDADCAGLNARCVEHAGVGKSTCTVGAK